MVDQGIEPDVNMYTHLIATMAGARLEWQAYKLFSRMLEQGLQPLPETYEALQLATSTDRSKLTKDIEKKVREVMAAQPTEAVIKAITTMNETRTLAVRVTIETEGKLGLSGASFQVTAAGAKS
jgi:hypothetical protein